MSTTATEVATPQYMFRDDDRCLGPICTALRSGMECTAIYGFSDKMHFDTFRENSSLQLKPYPLVKVFLRDQAETAEDGLRLIVLDAAKPDAPLLHAATMAAVLAVRQQRTTKLVSTHTLTFDQSVNAYRAVAVSK